MGTITICDKCQKPVVENDPVPRGDFILMRPRRGQVSEVDLCGTCRSDLAEWFRRGGIR